MNAGARNGATSVRGQVGVRGCCADGGGGHPRFLSAGVEIGDLDWDVAADDEPINTVSGHPHLHLDDGEARTAGRDVDLLTVGA